MDLVYSVALIGLATVFALMVFLAARMPVEPAWASEELVANFWCVLITGLIAFGSCFGVRFVLTFNDQPVGLREAALIAGLLAAFYVVLRAMAPKRRLAEYAAGSDERKLGAQIGSRAKAVEFSARVSADRPAPDPELPKVA